MSDFVPVHSEAFGYEMCLGVGTRGGNRQTVNIGVPLFYRTIPIGASMSMEFDFVWGGRTDDPYVGRFENFFRIGYLFSTRYSIAPFQHLGTLLTFCAVHLQQIRFRSRDIVQWPRFKISGTLSFPSAVYTLCRCI